MIPSFFSKWAWCIVLCGTFLYAPASLAAQPLTAQEHEFAVQQLQETKAKFLQCLENVSDAQWNWKADSTRWSIAETAEHIALAENLVFMNITQNILKQPATPEKAKEMRFKAEQLPSIMADRTRKVTTIEPLTPKRTWATKVEILKAFSDARERNIGFAKTTSDDMHGHFGTHPALGTMDGYGWLVFIAAHANRHILQIEEVKATKGFPKL
jgi:hypothetical protein